MQDCSEIQDCSQRKSVSRMVMPIWIMSKGLPGPRSAVNGNLQLSGLLLLVQHLTACRVAGGSVWHTVWPTSVPPTVMDSVSLSLPKRYLFKWPATQTSARNKEKELSSWWCSLSHPSVLNFSFCKLYTAHGKRFHCAFHHFELTVIIIMLNLCRVLSVSAMLN